MHTASLPTKKQILPFFFVSLLFFDTYSSFLTKKKISQLEHLSLCLSCEKKKKSLK